ncbi:hypothetical protein G6O69_34450 [Pseudenhygromyxa sp. WMMC2535]|uniref:hypothetical protein n=1 Tax=Pseudenhygromyxa sp. WMMC2535 TaxID=2712867 RepID=UPI001552698D|nr:hypothetical protein [Pseudenhygromyxa sp. WMMC2535]NVB42974.1 hypothetical protein [Pseudenhygromyxa sp. WMMC2535]
MAKDDPALPPSPAQRLREAGKGELLEEIDLGGELPFGDGQRSATALCRTRSGLYLVLLRAPADEPGAVVDLLAADQRLRLQPRALGDRLLVDGHRLGIPWGRGDQVQRMIALVRVARYFGHGLSPHQAATTGERLRRALDHADGPWSWDGPFVDAMTAHERAWLQRWLDADERLLAWQETEARHDFDSPLLPDARGRVAMVISERRQALVAISPVGDVWITALDPAELRVETSAMGRALVHSGEHHLRVPLGDDATFAALAELPALPALERKRGLARALWRRSGANPESALGQRAEAILDELAEAGDPWSRVTAAVLFEPQHFRVLPPGGPSEGEPSGDEPSDDESAPAQPEPLGPGDSFAGLPAPLREALRALAEGQAEGEALVAWWRRWSLGPERGELIVELLCELGHDGQRLALPLHEQLRPLLQENLQGDLVAEAVVDFVLVEHLLELGEAQRAQTLLDARRPRLPSEELQDLLPPSPERGGQLIRVELQELAAAAQAQLGDGHVAALADLARLQPLAAERFDALVEALHTRREARGQLDADEHALLERAEIVRDLLAEDGFAPKTDTNNTETPRIKARALDAHGLELLHHPAARVDGVLGRLQGALAKVAVPDCSQLKSYCERANLAKATALARAIADATIMLGLGGVEPFVSRGDKSVGLRAYEDSTAFMLIGGDHLDPHSHAFLAEPALRFAVACELAHLRFAHRRVTSDEVWSGTLDLGLTGLSMLLAAAPLLKRLEGPAKHLLDKVGAPAVDRWRRKLAKRESHSLASDNSQLIAAHRVMQLSAERAGLVACGDPRAAIRAMFTVHPAHLSQWPLVESHGLRAALTRPTRSDDERERLRLEDLAVRVAALLSFYLSPDYAALRAAAFPAPA